MILSKSLSDRGVGRVKPAPLALPELLMNLKAMYARQCIKILVGQYQQRFIQLQTNIGHLVLASFGQSSK